MSSPQGNGAPASFVAAELLAVFKAASGDLVHIARSDYMAEQIADAIGALDPATPSLFLPAWDCLPYDRVAPSAEAMGRRMDAIRRWCTPGRGRILMITSLEAMLQRIPPRDVICQAQFSFEAGAAFDMAAFETFIAAHGYGGDGLVDEPGEAAIRQDILDIYPPAAAKPVRVYLSPDGSVLDLKAYDPVTQRTDMSLAALTIGPASELIGHAEAMPDDAADMSLERRMFAQYGELETLFDLIGSAPLTLGPDVEARVAPYVAVIDEARSAQSDAAETAARASLYLNEADWEAGLEAAKRLPMDFSHGARLPSFFGKSRSHRLAADFAGKELEAGSAVILCGDKRIKDLARRFSAQLKLEAEEIDGWDAMKALPAKRLYVCPVPLNRGYVDRSRGLAVIAVEDVLGPPLADAKARNLRLGLAEPDLRLGDVIVHENHGVGILRSLETTPIDGTEWDAVRLDYHGGASVLVPMQEFGRLWRYGSEPDAVALDRLHTDAWAKKRASVEKDVRKAARHLVKLAAERHEAEAPVLEPPKTRYQAFSARFPYLLTADQETAIGQCLGDLASGRPMNRLVIGDVGYGKTEIALRAASAAALAGFQVAVLAPTTVLARQHAVTFQRRFAGTGIEVELLSRTVAPAEAKAVKARLAEGALSIVVGTHAILAKDVAFARLALLVVDEEHRFGAKDKAAMRALSPALHVLTMTATPIPRTLQSALVGIQDISLLTTPPARRRPVRSSLIEYDPPSLRTALLRERRRGGQSFFVVPRIEDIETVKAELAALVPDLSVIVAHGKMPPSEMDEHVLRFANGEGDLLLSTNIIESGLDIPNANTIFVWRADRFGLAQLHQLRGRVGRGSAQGIAYFLTAPGEDIAEETRNRLSTMMEFDRLGSGMEIAMRDLDLRGAGDLIGEEQAGHLKIIGISLYQKMLADAVAALSGKTPETAPPSVSLGAPGHIPPGYIPDALVRLNLYTRLSRLTDIGEVDDLEDEIFDRFGEMPEPLARLLRVARIKIAATRLGIAELAAGPKALAVALSGRRKKSLIGQWKDLGKPVIKDDRYLFPIATETDEERLSLFEKLCSV